jgi:hypothetical protein
MSIKKETRKELEGKLNAALKILLYVDDEFLKEFINTLRRNEDLLVASKGTGMEVNAGETK